MEEEFYPRLCGGTFFTLLVERARHIRHSASSSRTGLNESEMLASLIRIFDPTFNISKSAGQAKENFYKLTNRR